MRVPPTEIVQAAQNCQKQHGLFASIQIAQWALESAWGSHCTGKYNFFGIKAKTGTTSWTHEYINGKYMAIQQIFADYESPQDAFNAHAELLTDPNGHYTKALPYILDLEQYINAIAPIYATDPNYAKNLINLIDVDQFKKYDII